MAQSMQAFKKELQEKLLKLNVLETEQEILEKVLKESMESSAKQQSPMEAFVSAIHSQKPITLMNEILTKNPEILDQRTKQGMTLLMLAADKGSLETVKLIIEKDKKRSEELAILYAQSNPENPSVLNQATALHYAALKGHIEVVEYLLECDAQGRLIHSSETHQGFSLFHCAIMSGNVSLLRLLVECYLPPSLMESRFKFDNSLYLQTAKQFGLHLLKSKTNHGLNGLHLAAKEGHFDIFNYLLKCCPELVKQLSDEQQTVLMMAVSDKPGKDKKVKLEMVKALMEVDPSQVFLKDNKNKTLIHYFSLPSNEALLSCLLNAMGNQFEASPYGAALKIILQDEKLQITALNKLSSLKIQLKGSIEQITYLNYHLKLIQDQAKSLGMKMDTERSAQALTMSTMTRNLKKGLPDNALKVKLLEFVKSNKVQEFKGLVLENPYLIYETDNENNTFLMLAAAHGHLDFVKFLVEFDFSLNPELSDPLLYRRNNKHYTAAHIAAHHGHYETLHYLLEHDPMGRLGLDTVAQTGYDLAHIAIQQGQLKVLRYLLEYSSIKEFMITSVVGNAQTLLHTALLHQQPTIAHYLMEHYKGFWPEHCSGNTSLAIALRKFESESADPKILMDMVTRDPLQLFRKCDKDHSILEPSLAMLDSSSKLRQVFLNLFDTMIKFLNEDHHQALSETYAYIKQHEARLLKTLQAMESLVKTKGNEIEMLTQKLKEIKSMMENKDKEKKEQEEADKQGTKRNRSEAEGQNAQGRSDTDQSKADGFEGAKRPRHR